MTTLPQIGIASVSGAMLLRYHGHEGERFVNDGVFSDHKMPLQYFFASEQKAKIIENAKQGYGLAKLAYEPKDTDRYEILKDKNGNPYRVTDSWGLDATAFKDKLTGKTCISIAGIETKHADGKTDTLMDALSAFDSTAGRASESLPNLVEFAKKVADDHGPIAVISGHSLGGYEGMQLKVIGDKQGFTNANCELYTFDMAGMTHGLAKNLSSKYGTSETEITESLHSKNVYSVVNDRNSFNTLGAQPGNYITATDPLHSEYEEHKITHLFPKRHVTAAFDKSFEAGQWFENDNYGHASGPEYLTAITAGGVAGAFNPTGYAIAAEPLARHLQGELGKLGGEYKHMLQDKDPLVIDGLRPEAGEKPKMYAYKHLNEFYLNEFNSSYASLTTGEQDEKLQQADSMARDSAKLEAKIDKVTHDYENRGTLDKALDGAGYGLKWAVGWVTDNEEIADLSNSQEELQYQNAVAAKSELQTYKQDCQVSSQKSDQQVEEKSEMEKHSTSLNGIKISDVSPNEAITHNIHSTNDISVTPDTSRAIK